MWLVIDSDVIGELCRRGPESKRLASYLQDRRASGATLVVTPQFVVEAEQAKGNLSDRLLEKSQEYCSGILARDAKEVLKTDVLHVNPFGAASGAGLIPIDQLQYVKDGRTKPSRVAFLKKQEEGYKGLKSVFPTIQASLKGSARDLDDRPFSVQADEASMGVLKHYIDQACAIGALRLERPLDTADYQRVWKRGQAYRLIVLIMLANGYRAMRKQGKGCLTDGRGLIESAYADELLTMDKNLVDCGQLAVSAGATLKFTLWEREPQQRSRP